MAIDGPAGFTRRGLLAAGAAVAVTPGLARRVVTPRAPVPVAPGLAIWPRDAWAPGPPTGALASEEVRFLLVHHTAESTNHTAAQVPSILGAMYAYHTGPKGWPDIAYNFLVDREGGVWEGRAGSLNGPVAADATGGNQGFDQLVCFIGDFTSVMPTAAAIAAGNRTLAWLAQRYGVDTSPGAKVSFVSRGSNKWPAGAKVTTATVAGHREMSTTACPGNTFYPYVRDQMQAAVHELRGGAPVAPATSAPAASAAASTAPPTTAAPSTTAPTTTASTTTSTTTTTAPPTTAASPTTTVGSPTTTASTTAGLPTSAPVPTDEVAAPASSDGGDGIAPVIPIAAATAVAGGALLWLRQRASHGDPPADDQPSS